MRQLKHSKLKNTGLIYELLVRQVASDTMSNENSNALQIIKRHFGKDSQLAQELKLYRTLQEEVFNSNDKSIKFIEALISARKQLNETLLKKEKYNLIKKLKLKFNIQEFFKSRVNNYKVHASTYKIFEYAEADDPKNYIENKFFLIEHVQRKLISEKVKPLTNENNDVRLLASKIIIDKFNAKYSNLNSDQKKVLREYINNVTNSEKLKNYIVSESIKLKKELSSSKNKVTSKILRIKINEVAKLLDNLQKKHIINDKDVVTILRYHELVSELKNIGSK
jgi:hypothetical protein